jgi:hypothetical protein
VLLLYAEGKREIPAARACAHVEGIERFLRIAASLGVRMLKITGGASRWLEGPKPLMRKLAAVLWSIPSLWNSWPPDSLQRSL